MQLTINHWLVMVLPIITIVTTFFVAEEYAIRKGTRKEYIWNPTRLHLQVLAIVLVGSSIAILLGYLSYAVIFKGFLS